MSELSERIAGLSPEKRELLARLLKKQGVATTTLPIRRRPASADPPPLSFAQQRLWFLDQLEPGSNFYNIFDTYYFNGSFDLASLERTLTEIVRRHEVLRSTIDTVDGRPVQRIAEANEVRLPLVDLTALPYEQRVAEASRMSGEEADRPYDLQRGPLVRFKLLRLAEDEHALLLSMHHIISDAWSLEIFQRELRTLYDAFSAGQPSPLPELAIQYADFAVWQREWLQGDVLESQLTYWTRQLADAPPTLELPTDKPRPPAPTHEGASLSRRLRRESYEPLKTLCGQEDATLFMTLLAAFSVLLHRYTDQDDIVIGTPVAGRNRSEAEALIGFFVNTLVIRTDLSGDPSFRGLLRTVKEVALGAYAHEDLPFERVVEAIHAERDLSRNPLFQVSFQLTNVAASPEYALEIEAGAETEVVESTAKFDLGINVWEDAHGLRVQADFSTDLFEADTIRQMLRRFETLLQNIGAHPDWQISQLHVLSDEDRHHMLHRWNDTSTAYPRTSCLHQLFEQQVARTPNALAVVSGSESLTFAELNGRANQVARILIDAGVGPEVTVGICMERSIEMVVGLLGILKAGGAYVPLDPDYPEQRLRFMIDDAHVKVLVTQSRFSDMLAGRGVRVVCLDAASASENGRVEANPESGATHQSPAYVIYTSGSTGTPKGVVVPHSAVARTVCNTNYISIESDDRIAQTSNSSFDAAIFEIWGALLNGATLVIVPKEVLISPGDLARHIRASGITILFLPTAVFNQVAAEDPHAFGSLRYLLFGGEAVDPHWVREVLRSGPPQHLLHMYGPTESTTYTSWHPVKMVSADDSTVPIGQPLSNTQIYLLDRYSQPVPVGVAGELFVGGDGLARGYLDRPDLTAERFLPNPFSSLPGERIYRTGDTARYRADGAIEFLGRRDEQVKIRGYRIELGEIECNLRDHPDVQEAIVIALQESPVEKRLIAYIVAYPNAGISASELRNYLRERTPDYMVPTAFVMLDQFPLTPNGKVDRRALPIPDHSRVEADYAFVSPRTPVEKALTKIFSEVLLTQQVGVGDNFFDLGGHSLLATQIISRIRDAFQIELPLRTLFSNPTVASLCVDVEQAIANRIDLYSNTIRAVSRDQYRARVTAAGAIEVPEGLKRSMQM